MSSLVGKQGQIRKIGNQVAEEISSSGARENNAPKGVSP
jgi:hypothetical protein